MKKETFDKHVENLYEALKGVVEVRYQERGQDALHDAFEFIYRRKSYKGLKEKLGRKSMTGWLMQSTIFAIRTRWRDESKFKKRYTLICDLEESKDGARKKYGQPIFAHGGPQADEWEAIAEYPIDIVHDVQVAIGTLSAYHQNLVYAYYYEGQTLKEISRRTGDTMYRVFTQLEIAKACLRTQLAHYRG